MKKISVVDKIRDGYYYRKLPLLSDLIYQSIHPADVGIIGSVSRENVGDMSLSRAIQFTLLQNGIRGGIQSLGGGLLGLKNFPKGRAIVAGGTIGREEHVRRLAEKYENIADQVSITGIAMWSIDTLSERSLDFLRSVSFISCRNREDVGKLRDAGVDGVKFAFDNAFALGFNEVEKIDGMLGINVVKRGMFWDGKRYVPIEGVEWGPKYIECLKCVVSRYISIGWKVVHVPFTKGDEKLASYVFRDLPVELHSYDFRVRPTYQNVSKCSLFIGTRYHSHIFALDARVPLLSMSYAPKCTLLKDDLGIPDEVQASRKEVVQNSEQVVKRFLNQKGFVLSNHQLSDLKKNVRKNILDALSAIN